MKSRPCDNVCWTFGVVPTAPPLWIFYWVYLILSTCSPNLKSILNIHWSRSRWVALLKIMCRSSRVKIWWPPSQPPTPTMKHLWGCVSHCWKFGGVPHCWKLGCVFHCGPSWAEPHCETSSGEFHCWAFGVVPHCKKLGTNNSFEFCPPILFFSF